MLRTLVSKLTLGPDVNLKELAAKTAAMLPVDLIQVTSQAVYFSLKRLLDSR